MKFDVLVHEIHEGLRNRQHPLNDADPQLVHYLSANINENIKSLLILLKIAAPNHFEYHLEGKRNQGDSVQLPVVSGHGVHHFHSSFLPLAVRIVSSAKNERNYIVSRGLHQSRMDIEGLTLLLVDYFNEGSDFLLKIGNTFSR